MLLLLQQPLVERVIQLMPGQDRDSSCTVTLLTLWISQRSSLSLESKMNSLLTCVVSKG